MKLYIPLASAALLVVLGSPLSAQSRADLPPAGARTLEGRQPYRGPRPTAYFGFRWSVQDQGRPVVSALRENSPATAAGLVVGDTILAVDGRDTLTPAPLFAGATAGRRYKVRVARAGKPVELEIVAAPLPEAR